MKNARPIGIWKLAQTSSGSSQVVEPQGPVADGPVVALGRAHRPARLARAAIWRSTRCRRWRWSSGMRGAAQVAVLPLLASPPLTVGAPRRRPAHARAASSGRADRRPSAPAFARRRRRRSRDARRRPRCSVPAHAASATFTWPCSCSSGTGSSWSRSPSSDRPARGRKNARWQWRQVRVPDSSRPSWTVPPQPAQTSR